jgi:hypothetical protein
MVPPPIVEVVVSPRCEHGCFWVQVENTESVWRIEGQAEGELCPAGDTIVFHAHRFDGDPDGDACTCWDPEP